ncbi:hypothetical protein LEN26_007956 [Aphanomyces euteiches]|nr:hypothetical protein AeMF1_007844 [Aphanomyces euteiches]KAH9131050.1 hypothetical protein LEN26_007956 [Aphanomyces euteiches]KAH9144340.1 hypothetical protein AeRB84_011712 [Aphanomyces euteiches]KAH9197303.1 hypothetical protein AeNC1_000740 [Aphanomyces euteiches]
MKHRRGSYTNERANEWLRDMMREAKTYFNGLDDVLVIFDNAPCHSRIEHVFEEQEFQHASLFRLSKYSPMLNPIENLWSKVKSRVKILLRQGLAAFLGPPPVDQQITRTEYRLQYLEHCAEQALGGKFEYE